VRYGARASTLLHRPPRPRGTRLLRLAAIVGLALSSYVHAHLAARYGPIRTSVVSQKQLFYAEALSAGVLALALALTSPRLLWFAGLLVAAGSLGAVLLYRYFQIPQLGPLPSMYEPIWFTEKSLSAAAEAVAALACLLHLAAPSPHSAQRDIPGHR